MTRTLSEKRGMRNLEGRFPPDVSSVVAGYLGDDLSKCLDLDAKKVKRSLSSSPPITIDRGRDENRILSMCGHNFFVDYCLFRI